MDTTNMTYYWATAIALIAFVIVGAYLYTGGTFTNVFGSTAADSAQATANAAE